MNFNKTRRGFTLIEVVMVLIFIGILSAVAIGKYYDLTGKSEKAKAYAYANKFAAELNSEIAKRMLGGMTCEAAKVEVINSAEFGVQYLTVPNSDGMIIGTMGLYDDSSKIIPVGTDCGGGSGCQGETIEVPSGIVRCKNSL